MGRQLAFHVDSEHCIGCKACQIACKDRWNLELGQNYRKVVEYEQGGWVQEGAAWRTNAAAYWVSISCNHCADPGCVKICPTGATYKRAEDGVVLIDQERCVGCQSCSWACPYDAPQYNPATGKMGRCNLCVDRLAEGKNPVCVDACPYGLITYGEIEEIEAEQGGTPWVQGLPDPRITKPSLRINPAPAARRSALEGSGK